MNEETREQGDKRTRRIVKKRQRMKEIKIGLLQQHNTANSEDNMRRLAEGIEKMAKEGAQLVVLQELHNSLYFCQVENVNNFDLAEPIPGPSTEIGRAHV